MPRCCLEKTGLDLCRVAYRSGRSGPGDLWLDSLSAVKPDVLSPPNIGSPWGSAGSGSIEQTSGCCRQRGSGEFYLLAGPRTDATARRGLAPSDSLSRQNFDFETEPVAASTKAMGVFSTVRFGGVEADRSGWPWRVNHDWSGGDGQQRRSCPFLEGEDGLPK